MNATYINYEDTGAFSKTLLAYLDRDPVLQPFISDWPELEAFGKQISRKQQKRVDREALIEVLRSQYGAMLDQGTPVGENIQALADENTFTVATGHQLNIFTGPLYFIYKIATTIRLAADLKAAYPDYNFVPVYWMATEDHDFEEINHTFLLGERIAWDTPAIAATGRMSTESIRDTVNRYRGMLGLSGYAENLGALIDQAYLGADNLAAATRNLVHALFGSYGLVVIDADDVTLKRRFLRIMQDDIRNESSYRAVRQTSKQLESSGLSVQVNARPINFFYLTDAFRERIVSESGQFRVLNREITFTEAELLHEMEDHPERFSPNVIMRPLYQEVVLPNLAYIGGGAEIAYWLQLKGVFETYETPFPLLIPRNSALIAHASVEAKLNRFHLNWQDLFLPINELHNRYVQAASKHSLDLRTERMELDTLFDQIRGRATDIDPTLGPSVDAVRARLENAMNRLQKKMLKAEKRNHAEALQQLQRVKHQLFPAGMLQERRENFGLHYVQEGPALIARLIRSFRPLDFKFTILH